MKDSLILHIEKACSIQQSINKALAQKTRDTSVELFKKGTFLQSLQQYNLTLTRLPRLFIIGLRHRSLQTKDKSYTQVNNTLDIPWQSNNTAKSVAKYRLRLIIAHIGSSIYGGHYVVWIKIILSWQTQPESIFK